MRNNVREEFYRYEVDARRAAEAFAENNNGYIAGLESQDDRSIIDRYMYMDDFVSNLQWCGEVSSFRVVNNDTYEDIGSFAYWE